MVAHVPHCSFELPELVLVRVVEPTVVVLLFYEFELENVLARDLPKNSQEFSIQLNMQSFPKSTFQFRTCFQILQLQISLFPGRLEHIVAMQGNIVLPVILGLGRLAILLLEDLSQLVPEFQDVVCIRATLVVFLTVAGHVVPTDKLFGKSSR